MKSGERLSIDQIKKLFPSAYAQFNEIYLKIENILDQQYSLSDTAGSYGRTVSLGLKFSY